MTADDLERRAIIAAHDAECHPPCGESSLTYGGLTAREQAIVALWRADRDGWQGSLTESAIERLRREKAELTQRAEDYQGRYETSHDSRMHAEARLDAMTREARLSRDATGKAVARAKKAEAASERVRGICAWVTYKQPGDPDSYSTYREGRSDLAGEVLAALDLETS